MTKVISKYFILFLFFGLNQFVESKIITINEGGAVSLAYNFHDVDRISASNSMFKSRKSVQLINRNTFVEFKGKKNFVFIPLGILRNGTFNLDLFLKPKNQEFSKIDFFTISSSNKFILKNFSSKSKFEKFKEHRLVNFLKKYDFEPYSSECYVKKCNSKFYGNLTSCCSILMNQYKNINYDKFNQLKTLIHVPNENKKKFFGLIVELDKPLSSFDFKDGFIYNDQRNASITANKKYPNFIDNLPIENPKDKSIDNFIGVNLIGNTSLFFKINLPKKGENYFAFKLASLKKFKSEKINKVSTRSSLDFTVSVICNDEILLKDVRKFNQSDLNGVDRIFYDHKILINHGCLSNELLLGINVDFDNQNGSLFLIDPILYNVIDKKKPNLILITADALRYDHTSLGNYFRDTTPFLTNLAKNGISFSKYFVQRSLTQTSLPVIFTGKYPYQFFSSKPLERPFNFYLEYDIHKILFENGYNSYSIIGSQNFGKLSTSNRYTNRSFFDPNTSDFEKLVRGYKFIQDRESDRPFFLWVHLNRPHLPYDPESKFLKYSKGYSTNFTKFNWDMKIETLSKKKFFSKEEFENIIALYDDNIARMDLDVSMFFSSLMRADLLKNTLIVFTSDHGENMDEHRQYFQHGTVSNANLNVPLVIVYPEKMPKNLRVDSIVESVDLLPTILNLLQIKPPDRIDGDSLLDLFNYPKNTYKKYAYGDSEGKFFSIQNLDYKLIVNPMEEVIEGLNFYFPYTHQALELYNLKSDPLEKKNIFENNPEIAYNLLEKLIPYMQKFKRNIEREGEFTPEMLELLERTGYLHWKKLKK